MSGSHRAIWLGAPAQRYESAQGPSPYYRDLPGYGCALKNCVRSDRSGGTALSHSFRTNCWSCGCGFFILSRAPPAQAQLIPSPTGCGKD